MTDGLQGVTLLVFSFLLFVLFYSFGYFYFLLNFVCGAY